MARSSRCWDPGTRGSAYLPARSRLAALGDAPERAGDLVVNSPVGSVPIRSATARAVVRICFGVVGVVLSVAIELRDGHGRRRDGQRVAYLTDLPWLSSNWSPTPTYNMPDITVTFPSLRIELGDPGGRVHGLRPVELLHVREGVLVLLFVRARTAVLQHDHVVAPAPSPHDRVLHAGVRPGPGYHAGLDVELAEY